jgi:hypothetical protein
LGDLVEGAPVIGKHGGAAGELRPALHDHIDESRRQFHAVAAPPLFLCRNKGGARARERLVNQFARLGVVADRPGNVFRPDFKTEGLPVRHRRPTKSPYFAHGELTKRIYDAMRISDSVASAEIAAAAMRDKGLDPENDPVTRTDFVRRVTLQLNDMYRKGKAEKIGRGRTMRWKLAGA